MICAEIVRVLDPFVDGELEAERDAAVRDHIAACTTCAQAVAAREHLGRLVRATRYYSTPDRLRAVVATGARRSSIASRVAVWSAAAALIVAVAGGALIARTIVHNLRAPANAVAEDVVSDHVRSLLADHLFDVRSTDQHTVKPWFLGKLNYAPPVTDLAADGFPLVGGRLDYVSGRNVAALVYQRQKHTINLFVWPSDDGSSVAPPSSIRGFQVEHWIRDGMTFWAVSDLNAAELHEFRTRLTR